MTAGNAAQGGQWGRRWGGHLPTVAEVVAMDEVQRGEPVVVAGHAGLQERVRWVHVSEVPDIAHLLGGGELILTTGIALPDMPGSLEHYVRDLANAGAAGVVIELVRRYLAVPTELVRAADSIGLPLVALGREVPFVAITEAVLSRIVSARPPNLHADDGMHRALHTLALESGSLEEIAERMADLAGCAVVVENLSHQPVAFAGAGRPPEALLAGWSSRSRRLGASAPGWTAATLGARGQLWGRVVLLTAGDPSHRQRAVLEEGATALAVARLVQRDPLSPEQAARRTLLGDLVSRRIRSIEELHTRAEALGATTRHRQLRAVVVRGASAGLEATVGKVRQEIGITAIAGGLGPETVGVLLAARPGEATDGAVERLARGIAGALERGHAMSLAIGTAASGTPEDVEELARALAEADEAARAGRPPPGRLYSTVDDIRLLGLLKLLAGDSRLQRLVEAELGAIWDYDERHGTQLYQLVAAYVRAGGNKSVAAARSHLSRAAFYQHLERAGQILRCDLEDPESRTSLHVAVLAVEAGALGPRAITSRASP